MKHLITDLDDKRLAPYRNLRHRDHAGGFIAEGSLVVKRLLDSDERVHSLLVHDDQVHRYEELVCPEIPVYVVTPALGQQIAGYDFHRGVLAHGQTRPLLSIDEFAKTGPQQAVGLVELSDPENVGSLLRSAAAFGIRDILLGPRTISPFVRRVIRVSMASVFRHRFYDFTDPPTQIARLHELGYLTLATTLADDAVSLARARQSIGTQPSILLLGNEGQGLPVDIQNAASLKTKIDMAPGTDSLNVSVAGAIFLHGLFA